MTEGVSCGRALIIAPAFFGYEKDIVLEFERQGYDTTLIDERPSNSPAARAVLRLRKSSVGGRIDKYYRRKHAELSGQRFDLVLVVKAEAIPRWFLQGLRQENPNARFVFYSYDALSNVENCLGVLDCFDELFSFDSGDVEARPDFSYLPLFYTSEFAPLPPSEAVHSRRFTLSFVGTLHSERHAFVKSFFADRSGTFAFFYVQARWYFAVVKYLTREHSGASWSDVSFKKLSRRQVAEIFRESVAVLDMPRSGQSGLTMRTFEVLASGSVLVTTNAAITREPFYDPKRIIVVPGQIPHFVPADVLAELDSISPPAGPPESFDRYSLESWVRAIVEGPAAAEAAQ
jgi:hypothetical protein